MESPFRVLGKAGVGLDVVRAHHEARDIELPNRLAARTERLALGRSTTGECLGKPGKHHRLSFVVRQLVDFAVRSASEKAGLRPHVHHHRRRLSRRLGRRLGRLRRRSRHEHRRCEPQHSNVSHQPSLRALSYPLTMANFYDRFATAAARFPAFRRSSCKRRISCRPHRRYWSRNAAGVAAWLHAQGVVPDDRVAILADNDARWIAAYLGILRLGDRRAAGHGLQGRPGPDRDRQLGCAPDLYDRALPGQSSRRPSMSGPASSSVCCTARRRECLTSN